MPSPRVPRERGNRANNFSREFQEFIESKGVWGSNLPTVTKKPLARAPRTNRLQTNLRSGNQSDVFPWREINEKKKEKNKERRPLVAAAGPLARSPRTTRPSASGSNNAPKLTVLAVGHGYCSDNFGDFQPKKTNVVFYTKYGDFCESLIFNPLQMTYPFNHNFSKCSNKNQILQKCMTTPRMRMPISYEEGSSSIPDVKLYLRNDYNYFSNRNNLSPNNGLKLARGRLGVYVKKDKNLVKIKSLPNVILLSDLVERFEMSHPGKIEMHILSCRECAINNNKKAHSFEARKQKNNLAMAKSRTKFLNKLARDLNSEIRTTRTSARKTIAGVKQRIKENEKYGNANQKRLAKINSQNLANSIRSLVSSISV